MRWEIAAVTSPLRSRAPEDVIGWLDRRRGIERTGRNDDHFPTSRYSWQRTAALATEPFSKAFGRWEVVSGEQILSGEPFQLRWLDVQICCVTGTSPFPAARTMTVSHSRERWLNFKRDASAKTAAGECCVHLRSSPPGSNAALTVWCHLGTLPNVGFKLAYDYLVTLSLCLSQPVRQKADDLGICIGKCL